MTLGFDRHGRRRPLRPPAGGVGCRSARWPGRYGSGLRAQSESRTYGGGGRVSREVRVQHPGQQPDRPSVNPQVDVGIAQAHVTGLVQGRTIVAGEPGQAGYGQVVVKLLDGVGHGPRVDSLDRAVLQPKRALPEEIREHWGRAGLRQ
jgi:hypothetical protein